MGNFPVEEPTQVCQIGQLKTKQFAVEPQVAFRVNLLLILHALRDQHVLASVNDFVDLALDIAELILLSSKFVGLLELGDLMGQVVDLFSVRCILHFQLVVILYQSLHLLFQ